MIQAEISTPQGSSVIDYAYDHDGIRVSKTLNGTDAVKYLVDKNRPYAQVLEERNDAGNLLARYVYGDDLLSRTTGGVIHYYLYDGLGSTRMLSDVSGNMTDTYSYDAYGLLLNSTGTTNNPYLYRGEQYDPELNAYYLRARYYRPRIGRFLTVDPFEGTVYDPRSLHRYIYGNNDPIHHQDPSGNRSLIEKTIVVGILGTLGAMTVNTFSNRWSDKNRQRFINFSWTDERGKELLNRWLYGTGEKLTVHNGHWGEYMLANDNFRFIFSLKQKIKEDAYQRKESGPVKIRYLADLDGPHEFGGLSTGYKILHRTRPEKGNFTIMGNATVVGNVREIQYDLTYTWNDTIDPNPEYASDENWNWIAQKIWNPVDYDVQISWDAKCRFVLKGLPSGGFGYPWRNRTP